MAKGERKVVHGEAITSTSSTEQAFEAMKARWAALYPWVDEVIQREAEKVDGSVDAFGDETPSQVIEWQEAGVTYTLGVVLSEADNPMLDLDAAGRYYNWATRMRRVLQIERDPLPTPINPHALRSSVDDRIMLLRQYSGLLKNTGMTGRIHSQLFGKDVYVRISQQLLSSGIARR